MKEKVGVRIRGKNGMDRIILALFTDNDDNSPRVWLKS